MSLFNGKWFSNIFVQEGLTGTVNGVNDTFTVSNNPIFTSAIMIFINGVYLTPTVHYSVSGNTITFVTPPAAGQVPRAVYIRSL